MKKEKQKEFMLDIELNTKKYIVLFAATAGIITAGIITASLYFNAYKWTYQSPVIIRLQSPVIISKRAAVLISPVPVAQAQEATPAATLEATPEPEAILQGEASYYSREGCLGCSPTLTMANGEELDDSRYTVALTPELFKQYKNKIVLIENLSTGDKVAAQVTDSGGFAKYNRVADLSLATKQGLNCSDLCNVKIMLEVQQ